MKLDRNTAVAISFILLSASSAIYVSAASLNYLLFYSTLDEIDKQQTFQLDGLSLSPGSSNQSVLTAQVTVHNPTGYAGLRVSHILLTIYFYAASNNTDTLFSAPNSLRLEALGGQLGPNSAYSNTVQTQLTLNQSRLLTTFVNSHQRQVMAEVLLRVDLATFLVSVTGTVFFTRTQEIQLSTS